MSSHKKNKNKNKQNTPQRDLATEKLTEQMSIDEEEPKSSSDILAKYEKQEIEAAQRKAEREREAEKEREKKERPAPEIKEVPEPPAEEKAAEPQPEQQDKQESEKTASTDSDVKQFIPRSDPPPLRDETPELEEMNEVLAGEPEDMSEENEPQDSDGEAAEEPARPNRFYLVFAVFVIIMSVIGIISTVNFCAGIVSDIANRTELKNEIALFLYPVVSVDPPDCDKVEELPSTIIIESAIWRIILTGDNTNYEKLYNTYMYVPAIDVEFSVRSIFGSSVSIVHQTVGTMDMSFTYIESTNSYLVPINPHYTAYSPRITELKNVGELYTVTVEYIPPSALAVEGIEFETTAAKTMVYTLSKSKNSTVLHSIKNITRIGTSYEY